MNWIDAEFENARRSHCLACIHEAANYAAFAEWVAQTGNEPIEENYQKFHEDTDYAYANLGEPFKANAVAHLQEVDKIREAHLAVERSKNVDRIS